MQAGDVPVRVPLPGSAYVRWRLAKKGLVRTELKKGHRNRSSTTDEAPLALPRHNFRGVPRTSVLVARR